VFEVREYAMLLTIHHETTYRYSQAAHYSIQHVRLTPRIDGTQRILNWKLDLPGKRWRQIDAFGNIVHSASVTDPHGDVRIIAQGVVETIGLAGQLLPEDGTIPPLAYALPTPLTESNAQIDALARDATSADNTASAENPLKTPFFTIDSAKKLMHSVFSAIEYVPGATDVSASAIEAWNKKKGVCQDMTHVFLAACRNVGVPARYVSGYVLTDNDHAATHAWAEVWAREDVSERDAHTARTGWLGLDITHNVLAGPNLCRLAVGRDFMDASPVRGMRMGGTGEKLEVNVSVGQGREQQ
jgi:transglutaminase-like putative cysteine protease